ncbi:MAG: serine--tRNA ligase [Candidatus Zambryskibacteria bacterium CG10_big_fil_rev_8_21_14_0_10_42_12]|uniref:Serine--tRNA ligase n=1 Tax=Candidatus Zambryskibacteria bacterium CG10_big_fil_rev_8_21_14_0_10_42_12 TaxID=1975115 RepID=A0A2H0QVF5_9BACT|nr:MAG: serine--tRNA ligase [Candidatus Zambryskibacteria bacterium CG10_big_fil_rev_8_21_14_0_10_42_12]
MLDIKFIRENKDIIKEAARKKHVKFEVDELLKVDEERREVLQVVEELRFKQNDVSRRINNVSEPERPFVIKEMQGVKEELKEKEEKLKGIMKDWQTLMLQVPNIPDMSVPEGKTDEENKEVKDWGEKKEFSFKPKNHIELCELHDLADFERGTKIAGFRGYVLKNEGAALSFALWQLAFKHFTQKGFEPMVVPSLVRKELLYGSGYLPQGEDDLYKTQDEDYLAGTGEVSTMGYYMNEVLPKDMLSKKMLAFSPCFRREAGSHSKDTKGLMRVHEFFKLEQVVLCEASHEVSVKLHEEINRNTEELIEILGIPYRTVVNCGGDLGLGQVKKYDIELWVPSQDTYREISSASYFHDFQTRRLNIKYKDDDGTMRFAHSLNCTGLPSPRILIALLENNQNEDGSITIPEVLRPYLGGQEIINKKQ